MNREANICKNIFRSGAVQCPFGTRVSPGLDPLHNEIVQRETLLAVAWR